VPRRLDGSSGAEKLLREGRAGEGGPRDQRVIEPAARPTAWAAWLAYERAPFVARTTALPHVAPRVDRMTCPRHFQYPAPRMVRSVSPWLAVAMLTLSACSRPSTAPALVSSTGRMPAQPDGEPGAPAGKEGLSVQLGGMRLGMNADEFIATCRSAGGTLSRADEIHLACSSAPAPLRSSGMRVELGGRVAGKFCGPGVTVCELAYMFDADGDEQTAALVDMLFTKYGPPSSSEGHPGTDPMARCQKDRSVHFARVWTFGPTDAPPHAVGSARLVFACDLRVTAETHKLTLFYDDESGLRYRAGEHERRDNY